MDRFFSKLDLRDIKIDPEKSRFSPDDDFENVDSPARVEEPASPASSDFANLDDTIGIDETAGWESVQANEIEEAAVELVPDDVLSPVRVDSDSSDVLKVSAKSRPSAVAGAIAGVVREAGRAEVQAIGAGATNQAIKAIAIARDYLSETGIDAVCLPAFIDITIDNEDRTAIRLVIEPR